MRRPTLLVSFLVAAGALSGCGIRNTVHQKALADLQACQGKLGATETQRDTALARADKAEKELGAAPTPAQREATEALAKLTVEVAPTEDELRAVRNHREHMDGRVARVHELDNKVGKLVGAGKLSTRWWNGVILFELPAATLFKGKSATLSKAGAATIAELAAKIGPLQGEYVLVAAHSGAEPTPPKGRGPTPWQQTRARANAVVDALASAGISPTEMASLGAGAMLPIASGQNASDEARNSRIEIVLLPELPDLARLLRGAN